MADRETWVVTNLTSALNQLEPITFEGLSIEQWAALWKEERHKIQVLRLLIEKVNDIVINTDSTGRLRAIKNILVNEE